MTKWTQDALDFSSSVPALAYLRGLAGKPGLAQALGVAGYRLIKGESVSLSLPPNSPEDLADVMRYCHLCREESLIGLVRASWFNGSEMDGRPDLLVWTNAFRQMPLLRKDLQLGVQMATLNKKTGKLKQDLLPPGERMRSIVAQSSGDMTGLCEALLGKIRP